MGGFANKLKSAAIALALGKPSSTVVKQAQVPLTEGYMFHSWNNSIPARITFNGLRGPMLLNRNIAPGTVTVKNGLYTSVRPPLVGNSDKLWWDTLGHNNGQHVLMAPILGFPALEVKDRFGFSSAGDHYQPGYIVTDPILVTKVIRFDLDPITNEYIPSILGKTTNNRMPLDLLIKMLNE